jgi:hypothetical protein
MSVITLAQPTKTESDSVNVTRNKEVRQYLTERQALSETIRLGKAAEKRRKEMDESLLHPLLRGNIRFLVVLGQKVLQRSANPVPHTTFNAKDLQQGWPDAYEATKKVTEYYTLKGL